MNLTNDMIEKAKTASSADELLKMAKENGVNMTAAEAQEYFNFLNANGELSEDDLAQVAGGGKWGIAEPKYGKGQRVDYLDSNGIHHYGTIIDIEFAELQGNYYYTVKFDDEYPSKEKRTIDISQKYIVVIS